MKVHAALSPTAQASARPWCLLAVLPDVEDPDTVIGLGRRSVPLPTMESEQQADAIHINRFRQAKSETKVVAAVGLKDWHQ